jgi:hypothetical protein
MTSFKCWWFGHTFIKVGRVKAGLTLEKYVTCKDCGKTIISIGIHPRYSYIFKDVPFCQRPRNLYYERKKLKRVSVLKIRNKNNPGEYNDRTSSKPVIPKLSRTK